MSVFGCRGIPVSYRATGAYFFELRRQRRRELAQRQEGVVNPTFPAVEAIAHHDNLLRVFDRLKSSGGPAPGIDGITYADVSRREAAAICRALSPCVLIGTYLPHPTRPVTIPKASGGTRTLRLAVIFDRVLATALHEALDPVWDKMFLPRSFGFRPRVGTWHMLAAMEAEMIAHDRWVVVNDDIRQAFDNVALNLLLEDHARHIHDPGLLRLIDVVLRGAQGQRRTIGIDQGSAYSPTALNVLLHHRHDLALRGLSILLWYRYADNLVYLCRSMPEGRQVLSQVQGLLHLAELDLKGGNGNQDNLIDLQAGGETQLLGFSLSKHNGRLKVRLGRDAWTQLEEHLSEAHQTPNPPATAISVLAGWIEAFAPAYESWQEDDTISQILSTLANFGVRETVSEESLSRLRGNAWGRWLNCRQAANQAYTGAG